MVRVITGGGARPEWFDRNPVWFSYTSGNRSYGAATGSNTEWTHSVTAGKRALVVTGSCWVENDSTIALNARARAQFETSSDGATTVEAMRAHIQRGTSGPASLRSAPEIQPIPNPGFIRGTTASENNAAGTDVICRVDAIIVEFDA